MQSLRFAAQVNDLSGQMFVESRLMQFVQEGSAAVDDNLSSGPTHLQDSHLESLLLLCTLTQNHNPRRSRLQRFSVPAHLSPLHSGQLLGIPKNLLLELLKLRSTFVMRAVNESQLPFAGFLLEGLEHINLLLRTTILA